METTHNQRIIEEESTQAGDEVAEADVQADMPPDPAMQGSDLSPGSVEAAIPKVRAFGGAFILLHAVQAVIGAPDPSRKPSKWGPR